MRTRSLEGNTPLIEAAAAGQRHVVLLLLCKGADPDETNDSGDTALTAAARMGHLDTVTLLLGNGASINTESQAQACYTALTEASMRRRADVVEIIRDQLIRQGLEAPRVGRPTRSATGAAGHKRSTEGSRDSSGEIAGSTRKSTDGVSGLKMLIDACADGRRDTVVSLLDKGVDPDGQEPLFGTTPLMAAAAAGDTEIAAILLERGAEMRCVDHNASNPLIEAARGGHTALIQLLVLRGADVNAREGIFGSTALMEASKGGHGGAVRALLDWGADPRLPEKTGMTPLTEASLRGHSVVVELLKAYGAE